MIPRKPQPVWRDEFSFSLSTRIHVENWGVNNHFYLHSSSYSRWWFTSIPSLLHTKTKENMHCHATFLPYPLITKLLKLFEDGGRSPFSSPLPSFLPFFLLLSFFFLLSFLSLFLFLSFLLSGHTATFPLWFYMWISRWMASKRWTIITRLNNKFSSVLSDLEDSEEFWKYFPFFPPQFL